jgi:hypothetical protein
MPYPTLALVQQLLGNGFKSWIVGELDKGESGPFPGGLSLAGVADVRYWNWSRQMSGVQIEQKSYETPPREGISIAHFLTVADIERSARYYEKVFGARIPSLGDGNAPAYLPEYGETRCYIRDPDGYVIEVVQSTDLTYG